MHANFCRGHQALWERFYHPETKLCYDLVFTDQSQYPTVAEVAAEIPSCAGWRTGMEDCCLTGGFVLDGLVTAHRVTGEDEWADKARLIFQGLEQLGTVSGVAGYVARGFAPGRTDVYPNSSADQYTSYVWGLWNYAKSNIATAAERQTVTRLLVEVAAFAEASDHDLPRLDGRPSIYGDTSTIEPGRACRILMFYKAAYDLSGDGHWQERYLEMVEDQDRARISSHYGPEIWDPKRNVHGVVQSQAAFRLLYEAETDAELKAAYDRALTAEARSVVMRVALWREVMARPMQQALPAHWRECWATFRRANPDYTGGQFEHVKRWHAYFHARGHEFPRPDAQLAAAPPAIPWLRHQTQSLDTVMMCNDQELLQRAADDARPMLAEVDWGMVAEAGVWEGLEPAYWRGVEAGLFSIDS